MTKIWGISRALFVVLCVVIGGVQLIGRTQRAGPDTSVETLFTNPDGTPCQRPCLFGVRPGETSYQTAIKLLQQHPFTSHFKPDIDKPDIEWGVFSGYGMSVILFVNREHVVSRVDLVHTSDNAPGSWASLGEVVTVLGPPEEVGVDNDSVRSYYPAASMIFFHSGNSHGYVNAEDRFDCLFVFAFPSKTLQEPNATTWRGFTSTQRYRDAMRIAWERIGDWTHPNQFRDD